MHISDYDYDLPDELIAKYPLDNRSDSRLMILDCEIIGREKVLVYNSPYKSFNRRNEIIIPINYKKKLFKD